MNPLGVYVLLDSIQQKMLGREMGFTSHILPGTQSTQAGSLLSLSHYPSQSIVLTMMFPWVLVSWIAALSLSVVNGCGLGRQETAKLSWQ